jgi:hypothetical protein
MRFTNSILLLVFCLFMFSCGDSSGLITGESSRVKTPEELREELRKQEMNSPSQYVQLEGVTMKRNLVREAGWFRSAEYDGSVVEGSIKNTASIARFKDVVIVVEFYSKTETQIGQKEFVLYEYYEPNSNKNFRLKVYPPSEMGSYHVSIKNATPA